MWILRMRRWLYIRSSTLGQLTCPFGRLLRRIFWFSAGPRVFEMRWWREEAPMRLGSHSRSEGGFARRRPRPCRYRCSSLWSCWACRRTCGIGALRRRCSRALASSWMWRRRRRAGMICLGSRSGFVLTRLRAFRQGGCCS
jgi:hypothetical protein